MPACHPGVRVIDKMHLPPADRPALVGREHWIVDLYLPPADHGFREVARRTDEVDDARPLREEQPGKSFDHDPCLVKGTTGLEEFAQLVEVQHLLRL